jgi:hypothetical protein
MKYPAQNEKIIVLTKRSGRDSNPFINPYGSDTYELTENSMSSKFVDFYPLRVLINPL